MSKIDTQNTPIICFDKDDNSLFALTKDKPSNDPLLHLIELGRARIRNPYPITVINESYNEDRYSPPLF
mgnify:CR=1 FL=1